MWVDSYDNWVSSKTCRLWWRTGHSRMKKLGLKGLRGVGTSSRLIRMKALVHGNMVQKSEILQGEQEFHQLKKCRNLLNKGLSLFRGRRLSGEEFLSKPHCKGKLILLTYPGKGPRQRTRVHFQVHGGPFRAPTGSQGKRFPRSCQEAEPHLWRASLARPHSWERGSTISSPHSCRIGQSLKP